MNEDITINLNHDNKVVKGVIGLPTKFWLEIKERSADDTLPIAMVILWSQFSLSYLSVLVITKGDISFITAAFNPTLISTYAFVSVILGIAVAASLIVKYVNEQKTEKKELNEINETAAQVKRIKITPDLPDLDEEISIILPISENQETILKKQMEENRNKIILLIAPSLVVTTFLVIGALYKSGFSFANVSDWIEVAVIAITVATEIAGACILVNKLKNNEINKVNDTLSTVKKLSNAGILCPWKNDETILVMEGYAIDQEKDGPASQCIKLFDKHLTELTNKTVDSLDGRLAEATRLLKESLLEPASANIKGTLDHLKGIREDLKSVLDMLTPKIDKVIDNAKQLVEKMNSLDIEGTFSKVQSAVETSKDIIEALKKDYADTMPILKNAIKGVENVTAKLTDRIERFKPSRILGTFLPSQQSNQNEHRDDDSDEDFQDTHDWEKEITELQKELDQFKKSHAELKKSIAKMSSKQIQTNETDSGLGSIVGLSRNRRHSTGSLDSASSLEAQLNKEKAAKTKNERLKSRERTERLEQENAKLEKEHSQQKEANKRQEKLNSKLSNFVCSLLESMKLEGENEYGKISTTLRSCDNKVEISRIGSCPIVSNVGKEDGNLQFKPNSILIEQHISASQKVVSYVPLISKT